nr:hypothetical protein [Tanacetum cinerariifolium]
MQTQTSNTLHNAIMEAGSKDRPPMLAPGNYVQWKSRIKRYIDTKPNHELIYYCLENPPYELGCKDKRVPDSDGNLTATTERVFETYKNVTQDIRDQLNAKAEAVQIILTGIDNDIYSTSKILKPICIGNLENSHLRMVNHWNHITQEPSMVNDDDETSKDKEIDKLMALISLSFKKIYKPTNNNLRTSSNTSRANQDNPPKINRNAGYKSQRSVTAQTLPTNKKSIVQNTNLLAPGMYKLHTGVIPITSVSRPQLKRNPQGDRVMHNNSQGKKQTVEDHCRSVKISKNKTSVTACNDSLNAKTLNVKSVSAMCDKCVLHDKHDMCVLKSVAKPLKE